MVHLNFKEIIERFIPNIHHFIDVYQYEDLITQKIDVRNEKRELLDRGYNPYCDGDFYDLLFFTTRIGDGITDELLVSNMVNLLVCYDALLLSLQNRLTETQKTLLTDTISKVFRNANNQYRNYFGELFALDAALNYGFELIDTAAKLGNRKDVEYWIADKNNGRQYFLEVVNIKLTNPNPKIIQKKLNWKINDKLKGGVDGSNFILLPIVWSETTSNIIALAKGIAEWDSDKYGEFKDKRILQPFALFMIPTRNGMLRWEFCQISKSLVGFDSE